MAIVYASPRPPQKQPRDHLCPACGAPQPQSAKFCDNCGGKLPTPPSLTYCHSCGEKRVEAAKFCEHCGTKLYRPDWGETVALCSCGGSYPMGAAYCPYCGDPKRKPQDPMQNRFRAVYAAPVPPLEKE